MYDVCLEPISIHYYYSILTAEILNDRQEWPRHGRSVRLNACLNGHHFEINPQPSAFVG